MHPIARKPSRPTILMVERDAFTSSMVRDALESTGFDVIAVTAAEDALGLAVMDVSFDILFTEIQLAGDLDGWELAETLREMRPDLPVVYASSVMSARDSLARVRESLFVAKPCNPISVCAVMEQLWLREEKVSASGHSQPVQSERLQA